MAEAYVADGAGCAVVVRDTVAEAKAAAAWIAKARVRDDDETAVDLPCTRDRLDAEHEARCVALQREWAEG